MGVVQNSIDIQKIIDAGGDPTIAAKVAELEAEIGDENSGIIKDIDDLQETNALVMTSVSNNSRRITDIETELTPVAVTLTPYDATISIQEQAVYKNGNLITGYVRFTVSAENPSTGDYAVLLYPAAYKPTDITRAEAYSTWDASKKGIVNIQTNGALSVAANSLTKGQAYCVNFTWVIA